MNDLAHSAIADVSQDVSVDIDALMTSLRSAGADQFDPMRWHYIEALAKRASAHQNSTRRMLDTKLMQALTALKERFDQAQSDAGQAIAESAQRYPHAANELQRFHASGDFKGLRQFIATLNSNEQIAALGALARQLGQHPVENADARNAAARLDTHAGSRPELKAIRNFRNTWSKLSVDKQVAKALEQAPKNAGPINSHMLVLRSLAMMRDISPDYLNRFMSYADTLLCLDQCEKEKPADSKKPKATKTAKK